MPENEFEKKVSTELGGFKLKPSGEVWKKVEERIRRKNKRRVFVILFLLAGLALLGWWQQDIFSGNKQEELLEAPVSLKGDTKSDLIQSEKTGDTGNENGIVNEKPTGNPELNKENLKAPGAKNDNELSAASKEPEIKLSGDTEIQTLPARASAKKKLSGVPVVNNRKTERKDAKEERVMEIKGEGAVAKKEQPAEKQMENKQALQEIKKEANETMETDLVKTEPVAVAGQAEYKKDSIAFPEMLDDSSKASVVKPVRSKKWKWGIEFTPGISSMKDQLLTLSFAKSAELYSSPTGGSAGAPQPVRPSKTNAGFALQVGGFVKKQLSPRSSIAIGARYAYYSDVIRIGNRRNNFSPGLSQFLDAQGASSVYSAGDTTSFTNRYHFIELPVTYYFRLGKNETHPFTLQAGIKAGRLFSANTLVYDTAAYGIYYNTNKYLQKTQIGLTLGLSKTVFSKEKYQWTIGPVMDLHLNSLLKNPLEKNKYILFMGLRSSVLFQRKK